MKEFVKKILGTTTKQLTWVVAITWVGTIIMAIVAPIKFGVDLVSLVTAVSVSFGVVLSGYFTKSFLENREINSKVAETIIDTIEDATDF